MIVCICVPTTKSDILQVVSDGATSFQQVIDITGAGKGCGTCHDEIKQLLPDETAGEVTTSTR